MNRICVLDLFYEFRIRFNRTLALGMLLSMPMHMDIDISQPAQSGRGADVVVFAVFLLSDFSDILSLPKRVPSTNRLSPNKKPACRGLSLFSSLFFVAAIRGK